MSLDRTFSIRQIARACRPPSGRYGFHRDTPIVMLRKHALACHKGVLDPVCPACQELKVEVEKEKRKV